MEIDISDYNIDALRDYIRDYFGTAMTSVSPFAIADLIDLDSKSDYEIIVMAIKIGINVDDFLYYKKH